MPISRLQSDILALIALNRDPDSFVAGGVPINRDGPRFSKDIDIFHNRVEHIADAATRDMQTLTDAGYTVRWLRQLPAIMSVDVRRGTEGTKLEWVADSDFRYFPPVPDDQFGYVLHMADLAVNKLMAAVGRREPRDVVDLLTVHDRHLPLGAIAWAAVEVAPGFTPEGLIAELRRNARYTAGDYLALEVSQPLDAVDVITRLREAADAAERFIALMPSDKAGRLFLRNGVPVQPDPARLGDYQEHLPRRRGHWPASPGIVPGAIGQPAQDATPPATPVADEA